jgi:hypothetical protein
MTRATLARYSSRFTSRSMMLATMSTSYGDILSFFAAASNSISRVTDLYWVTICLRVEVAVESAVSS